MSVKKVTRRKTAERSATDRPSPKLAEHVAGLIEQDIINGGWKVGSFIGSEADLVQRYGIGRWVMREAMGIVERDGLIEVRRGRNGGIMISAPALDVVGSTIRSYLGVCHIAEKDLYEARLILEGLAMRLLAQRLMPANLEKLRALSAEANEITDQDAMRMAYRLLEEMLRATGNIALEVFTYSAAKLTTDLFVRSGITEHAMQRGARTLVDMRRKQLAAIIAGDAVQAERLVAEYLVTQGKIGTKSERGSAIHSELLEMPRKSLLEVDGVANVSKRPKLTNQLTQLIETEIVTNDWPVGRRLGTEAELMARYHVSRAVLREAIRPLERLGVVEMCRGRDSGLRVTKPDPAAVIRSTVRYLTYCKLDADTAEPVRDAIEISLIQLKAGNSPDKRAALATRLRTVADSPPDAGQPLIHELSQVVAEYADNPILGLYCRILIAFSVPASALGQTKSEASDIRQAIRELADALEAGDAALARSTVFKIRHA